MRKRKSMLAMLVLLCTLFVGSMVYAASTSASVSISKDNYSKSSSSVGVSTSANFSASNYSSSTKHMTMEAYACWTGWPYTCESSTSIAPSGKYNYTEKQSKNSSFYINLIGYYGCNGKGSVSAK